MIQSIKEGKCPHVDDVDKKFVTESIIFGVNIAAAVDNYDVVFAYHLSNPFMFLDSIFHLRPFHLAALKQNIKILRLILSWSNDVTYLTDSGHISMVPEIRITESSIHLPPSTSPGSHISVYTYEVLEYAVKTNSIKIFELLSHTIRDDRNALDAFIFALRENQTQCQKAFVHNFKGLLKRKPYGLSIERIMDISALPVLYENANIFESILKMLRKSSLDNKQDIFKFVSAVSYSMNRVSCMDTVRKYSHTNHSHNSYEQVTTLLHLLHEVADFRDEIMSQLFKIHDLKEVINEPDESGRTIIARYLEKHFSIVDHRYVKDLITLGVKVTDSTVVDMLLNEQRYLRGIRESLDAILYENPTIDDKSNAVVFALERKHTPYYMYKSPDIIFVTKSTVLIADRKEHLSFETKEWTDTSDYFLLTTPLIEAGYPFDSFSLAASTSLDEHLEDPSLKKEIAHLKACTESPRRLQLCCRDVLRRQFPGRKIHMFTESQNIPTKIKNFILLKDVLFSI